MDFLTEDAQEAFWRPADERLANQRTYNQDVAAVMFGPWITALNQMSIAEVLSDVTCSNYEEKNCDPVA